MQTELIEANTTAIAKQQPINWVILREQALSTFDIQSEAIAKEVAADTQLKVTDDNTRKAAKDRHWVWVKRRTGLDKTRKAASADAKKIVALVSEVAESFQSEFDKAEQHLEKQIAEYDDKIAKEKQAAIDAEFNAKNERLIAAGIKLQRILVESMSDIDIDDKISEAVELARFRKEQAAKEAAAKAEADRLSAEEKERNRIEAEKLAAERAAFAAQQAAAKAEADLFAKIEAEKLAAERAELERQKAEQAELQRSLHREQERLAQIERDRIAAEQQAERDRVAEENRVRLEAERKERERIEAEAKAAREVEEAKAKAAAEETAKARAEALRPDREKLLSVAAAIHAVEIPQVSDELSKAVQEINKVIIRAVSEITVIVHAI